MKTLALSVLWGAAAITAAAVVVPVVVLSYRLTAAVLRFDGLTGWGL